jgi:hypothetical protein
MAQAVECQPSKHKALSSNPSTAKNNYIVYVYMKNEDKNLGSNKQLYS